MKSECARALSCFLFQFKKLERTYVCGTLFEIYSQKVLESLTYVSCGQKLFS